MDKLFVATERGKIPIAQEVAEKYNLKKGTKTPFSNNVIVDKTGDATPEPPKKEVIDAPDEKDEVILTTAEALDFAAGADS